MSSRSLLIIAIISATAFTGCKTVYSSVYTNRKNSFKPPVAIAKNQIKGPELIDRLMAPPPSGIPGGDQNTIPGLDPAPPPMPAVDPAAPVIPPAPAPTI